MRFHYMGHIQDCNSAYWHINQRTDHNWGPANGRQYKLKEGIHRNKSLQGSPDDQYREITELNHFIEEITLKTESLPLQSKPRETHLTYS